MLAGMNERPMPDDDSELPIDPAPGGDTERKPGKTEKPKVTPLDENKNIEDGIEIKET
jgi:hypothetical protein